ncbi:MAG: hypothetical protein V3S41_01245 [Spirochaetia bacterium]
MYHRFGLLYVVFSLLVLSVLVVLVVVRVNTIREFNVQEAQTSFIRLQGRVREALDPGDGRDGDLGSIIREYAEQVPTVQAIVLYDPNEGLHYVWTSDVEVLAFAKSDLSELRGFPSYDISDVSQIKVGGPFEVGESSRLFMDGIYGVLSYSDAYVPLRDSLIALLAFAFVTVLIAIGLNLSRRSPLEPAPLARRDQADMGAAQSSMPTADDRRISDPAEATPQRTPSVTPTEPLLEEVDIEEIATDPGEPGTLFSPVTNLSYRVHLERRLGLELERAAYNDQDLTCALVRFEDATEGGEAYSRRAGQILAAFKFEDLCFEYGDAAFCVILPNTELSRGIREAESFKGDHRGKIYFGLSARNGRLVEASRVLGEAERSLEHAQHEPGGIVGFRPDPRKYRQFVTQHLGPGD